MTEQGDPQQPKTILQTYLVHKSPLKAFISRFVYRPQDIEDISQEAFMRAFKAEKTTKIRNPKAFLFKTARNIALNELTRKSNILTDYIEDNCAIDVISNERPPDEQYDDRQRFKIFCDAVGTLPPQCQRVFVMRKVYGFSQKEISRSLGISTSTVEKHVASGLLRCRAYMLNHQQTSELVELSPSEKPAQGRSHD